MRSYPIPTRLLSEVEGDGPLLTRAVANGSLDRDDLERAVYLYPTEPIGIWANQVIAAETSSALAKLMGGEVRLPMGVLHPTEEDVVTTLTLDGRILNSEGEWVEGLDPALDLIELNDETVVDVAEAITAGADGVVLRPWMPLAIIAAPAPGAAPVELPAGAKVVAVVDELDRTAVLELLAVAPGPKVYRRNDGTWNEDDGWLNQLRGVKPPPLVELDPVTASGVASQVDESTKGEAFVPYGKRPVAASAWAEEHQARADDLALRLALVAASKAGASIKGHAMGAEKLKLYWTTGEGGLRKIRWGTPGAWGRCHKHLLKYLGPRAAGFCTNLGQRLGGRGVAWDVGGGAKRSAKKALK